VERFETFIAMLSGSIYTVWQFAVFLGHLYSYPEDNVKSDRNILAINPLKPELNPFCYLLALLGAHHFLHISRIRVKLLILR